MTEAEWLGCPDDPDRMSTFLNDRVSDRKVRLYTVACCRRIWHLLSDPRSRTAVETAERFAEGRATLVELASARQAACDAYQDGSDAFYRLRSDIPRPHSVAPHAAALHAADPTSGLASQAARSAAYAVFHNAPPFTDADAADAARPEQAAQVRLIRCIFGNPFRPVAFDANWRTADVLGLARGIYEDRAFDRLPVLADALMDAGCDDADILSHCRGEGPHVRGCWVVDLVLGKE